MLLTIVSVATSERVVRQLVATLGVLLLLADQCHSFDSTKFNFVYPDGDRPWTSHTPIEINTTFDSAIVRQGSFLNKYRCSCDSTEIFNSLYQKIEAICLCGNGAKMVIPLGYPTWKSLVFKLPLDEGLVEQKHMTGGFPNHFYDGSGFTTKYFLIPFSGYEIPTFRPIESIMYLPLWKQLLIEKNGMSDRYFDEHIRLKSTMVRENKFHGKLERYFQVSYYFYVDWARIELIDEFIIEGGELHQSGWLSSTSNTDSISALKDYILGLGRSREVHISRMELVESIASKNEIIQTVVDASPLLTFSVERGMRLSQQGHFVLRAYGTVDYAENRCIQATILLKEGKVIELRDIACLIR